MAFLGKIHEPKPESEPWSAYVERVEVFSEANDVSDDKRGAGAAVGAVGGSNRGIFDRNGRAHLEPERWAIAERFNQCGEKQTTDNRSPFTVLHDALPVVVHSVNLSGGGSLAWTCPQNIISPDLYIAYFLWTISCFTMVCVCLCERVCVGGALYVFYTKYLCNVSLSVFKKRDFVCFSVKHWVTCADICSPFDWQDPFADSTKRSLLFVPPIFGTLLKWAEHIIVADTLQVMSEVSRFI